MQYKNNSNDSDDDDDDTNNGDSRVEECRKASTYWRESGCYVNMMSAKKMITFQLLSTYTILSINHPSIHPPTHTHVECVCI